MKIAHVVFVLQTGGTDLMVVNLINEQVKTLDVRLFVLDDYIDESIAALVSSKCKIVRLQRDISSKNPLKLLPWACRLNWQIWRFHPNIVHTHTYGIIWGLLWPWKIVRTTHEIVKGIIDSTRYKAIYTPTEAIRRMVLEAGCKNCVVVSNGIHLQDIKTRTDRQPVPSFWHIVQVGRLEKVAKGQDLLLNAAWLLRKKGVDNLKVHFIGDGPSDKMLHSMVQEMALTDVVVFEGKKTPQYIYQHLCDYNLLVQPSHRETFGLTVAEAMAARVPVLVSNIDTLDEVVGHGRYGMSFKAGSALDLAEKLMSIIKDGYSQRLVDDAYRHAHKEYGISRTAARYLEEYRKVIKGL